MLHSRTAHYKRSSNVGAGGNGNFKSCDDILGSSQQQQQQQQQQHCVPPYAKVSLEKRNRCGGISISFPKI